MNDIELELHKCTLCYEGKCKEDLPVDLERIIRAVRFDNIKGACYLLNDDVDISKIKKLS